MRTCLELVWKILTSSYEYLQLWNPLSVASGQNMNLSANVI